MKAEIAKVRYLPLPRVVAAVAFVVAVLPGTLLFIFHPAHQGIYLASSPISFSLVLGVLAIALGTWMATIDVTSGTLQRTLTAESDRNRVLASKFVTLTGVVVLLVIAAGAVTGGLTDVAMDNVGQSDRGALLRALLGTTPDILLGAWIGFGFGLLTRSMGGGMTLAIVFAFVVDGFIGFIPHAGQWYYSSFTAGIDSRISGLAGAATPDHGLALSVIGALVWAAIVVTPGWVAFNRGDLK